MAILPVKIKKVHPDAKIPEYATDGSACLDLTAVSEKLEVRGNGMFAIYDTGLSFEIPEGYVGLLFPRSSINTTTSLILGNSIGVIDSDFRGSVKFVFRNIMDRGASKYKEGKRVGQMMILPIPKIEFEMVEELSETERGDQGFGSTGE